MDLFTLVEGGNAILRAPKGVLKQTQVYRRGSRLYVKHSGGFVELRAFSLETKEYSTSHPDIKVVEFEIDEGMLYYVRQLGQKCVRWVPKGGRVPDGAMLS